MNQQLILLVIGMVALFYFLIYRPQQRAKRNRSALDSALDVGKRVVTVGGMHGEIRAIDQDTADVEVADGVVITFDRRAISGLEAPEPEDDEDEIDDDDSADEADGLDDDSAVDDGEALTSSESADADGVEGDNRPA